MTKLGNSAARWDKLKSWHSLAEEVQKRLESSETSDEGITLDVGPQLLHTLRHPSALRSMVHTGTKLCNIFTAQYNKGAVEGVRAWILETSNMGVCKYLGFETQCEITAITYVLKHRVYLTFSSDLVLRVFTDFNSNFVEVDSIPSLQTTLCLVYNKEEDEVYAGGIGFVEEWKIHGAEHAAKILPGRKFYAELTRNDWIRDIQLVHENNQIILQHGNGLSVLQLKTRKALHRLPNRHGGPLNCFCYYPQNDFLITGGADGKIKVFNGSVFNLMNSFIAHYGPVTGLECHKQDTLLFSCSHDGTLRIWHTDTFQLFMRLDIGERIQQMSLLENSQFFLQTDKDILIYTLNQFYQSFAAVQSETKRLMCCRGKGNKTRILGSTEDGSVRLFSPVTGLTLTIIYPMPFFQVLMSFAYDLYQDKLHTVLTGGKVLTFNTGTNPCKAEEILVPCSEDEHVNVLLLVTVEFPCEDGTDIDNLVFAGLTNGQIVLIEALVCSLPEPLQAHEGSVTCMEACLSLNETGTDVMETTRMIISGGTDMFVKIWSVDVEMEGKRPVINLILVIKINLTSCPLLICMYSNLISVALCDKTSLGRRWCLLMYKLVPMKETLKQFLKNVCAKAIDAKIDPVMPLQISHPPDEDHTQELLSLDMCPMLNLILTSGLDGYVKVWNHHNELLREMNFATPIYAACFANNKGDILVGYGTNICSVAATTYLPLTDLKTLLSVVELTLAQETARTEIREVPVRFDHKSEPWLDLDKIKKYPIDIVARQRQRLTEDIINQLKKGTKHGKAPTKFVIFVDAGITKVIRKDFADRLLNWAKGKTKLRAREKRHRSWDINALTEGSSDDEESPPTGTPAKRNVLSSVDKISAVTKTEEESRRGSLEPQFLDSENLLQIYPSSVGAALRALESRGQKGPVEMKLLNEKELLKRDPIIAPDGYIPNSVIRSRLKLSKDDTSILRRLGDKPFQLKPVPKANPHHLPSWWGLGEDKDEAVSGWEDSTVSERPTPGLSARSQRRSSTNLSAESGAKTLQENRLKPTSTAGYKLKSKRYEFNRYDLEMNTPGGRKSRVRSSEKLTSLAVDEDSSTIRRTPKSGRKSEGYMNNDIIKSLMSESWMPKMDPNCDYKDFMGKLISSLDSDNPIVYDRACSYLTNIFNSLGLPEEILDMTLGKLGKNMDHINSSIKQTSIKTAQMLGQGRNDVILLLLPKLTDPEDPIRKAAADAITLLTGAQDKDQLLNILEQMGIINGVYSSKEDEEYALSVLAERFGEQGDDPQYFDRIQDWVKGTTPGLFEDEQEEGGIWQDGTKLSRQFKEKSFLSEGGKSGKKDAKTPRSKRGDTGSILRKRLQDMDGFSTISDRSSSSRRSGRFTPKDPKMYQYYDNRQAAQGAQYRKPRQEEEEIEQRDSDFHTLSNVTSSRITDRLSGYDSGISKDMSEFSQGRAGRQGHPGAPLSPVKSESGSPRPMSGPHTPQDWRKFFEMVPNAAERRQMEQIRREMIQGKLKPSTLPPISYFAEDLPMLPGEAGTRLLQTVRVGEKVAAPGDGRHRIESVPGKLAVHTQNEDAGLSNYGILQMQWTTGVPTLKDHTQPPQRIPKHRSQGMIHALHEQTRADRPDSEQELHLPHLKAASPSLTNQITGNQYEWEFPLPPPPAKESRPNMPSLKKDHESYCKYYHLVKKKLHLYTSPEKVKTKHLPEVFVKRLREGDQGQQGSRARSPVKQKSLTKTDLGSTLFPPIKLGQIVNIY